MNQLPNFVGVNCAVNGNTLTALTGFPPGTNGFTAGAFSQTGYAGVVVSAVNGTPGSNAMLIGLNVTPVAPVLPVGGGGGDSTGVNSTYQLYFHTDTGQYLALINGAVVAVPSAAPVPGDVGSITYSGTSVVWAINGVPFSTFQVPVAQTYALLYITWASFYLNAVSTLTVTPVVFSVATAAPYAALITSEHNQKPNFMALVSALTAAVGDTTAAIQSLVPAFNLNTATGAQLDVIGLWVGQSRVIPGILVPGFFGFSELGSGLPDGLQSPFGELTNTGIGGVWFDLGDVAAGTTTLNDAQYLTILKARIARNQSNGTLSALENALFFIFGSNCRVADNGTLSLTITVTSPISPVDQALITGLDILPRPAGIAIGSIVFTP